tara:strand:- start:4625 stop:5026 length:402 start_codon:yes stop_codon:yes gene_type:complete
MVKFIQKRGRVITVNTAEGEIKLVKGKEVDIPFRFALGYLGSEDIDIKFEKKDESDIKKLKGARLGYLQKEFNLEREENNKELLNRMFPKAVRKSPIRKAVKPPVKKEPLKPPIKAKTPKTKPKVDKAKATEK